MGARGFFYSLVRNHPIRGIMAIERPGNPSMRTKIIISCALLSLGLALAALATPRIQPPPSSQGLETQPAQTEAPRKHVAPVAPPRGQLLYENHCLSCHESVAHIRSNRNTHSLPELRGWVRHWAEYSRLPWGKEEVEDVVRFLNSRYYKFESR